MSQLVLGHHRRLNSILNRQGALPLTLGIGKYFLFFSLTFLIGFVSFLYMVKFTEIHTKGYEVNKLEMERDKLLTERELHRKDIESLKSLQTVRDGTQYMVAARNTTFVTHETGFAALPHSGVAKFVP